MDFGTPALGRIWTVRYLAASISGGETDALDPPTFATTTFATGAAANISLPSANYTVTGIDATIGNAVAAGNVTVTLSNVAGGPLTWTIGESTTSGEVLNRQFGTGLAANGTPNLAISALLNGGSGTLTVYAQPTDLEQVNWYIGPGIGAAGITSYWRENQAPLPARTTYTSDIHQVRYGDHLYAVVSGGALNDNVVGNVVVLDEPVKSGIAVMQG
jgi:hypothetical protein